jgi:protein-disulfide isomerase
MTEKRVVNLTTPILVALLVVVSFLLGTMWTRLRVKEQGNKGVEEKKAAQNSPSPEEAAVLGEKEMLEITEGRVASRGKKDAPITIVEFSEYQCPYCKRYVDETYVQIWEEYGDQVHYVFRDYPLPFHPHAQKTAEAARCAGDQGQYWPMHDLLFDERDQWAEKEEITADLSGYASQLGLDQVEFEDCLSSGKQTQAVKDDLALGNKVGVSGTPTFFINGQKLVGAQPFTAFKAIIEEELKD